jgi:hypothetical protein
LYPRLSSSDWESARLKIWLSPVQIRAEALSFLVFGAFLDHYGSAVRVRSFDHDLEDGEMIVAVSLLAGAVFLYLAGYIMKAA